MRSLKHIASKTRERIRRINYNMLYEAGIGFWAFIALTFVLGIVFFSNIKSIVSLAVSDYGYIGIFGASFMTDLLVQPIGPDVPLVLGVFAGLNPWIVFTVVLIGAYLALAASYYIGKTIGAAGIERIVGKKTFAKIHKYKIGPRWFMFIGALTPVPYIPYLAGLWEFNLKDTLLYVVLPRTLRFAFVLFVAYRLGISIV